MRRDDMNYLYDTDEKNGSEQDILLSGCLVSCIVMFMVPRICETSSFNVVFRILLMLDSCFM